MAGVGVSLGTLGLVRVDGRPCLGRCSHTTISRLRLSDRPLVLKDRPGPSTIRAAVRRRVLGFFSGARLRAPIGAILDALTLPRQNGNVTGQHQELVHARGHLRLGFGFLGNRNGPGGDRNFLATMVGGARRRRFFFGYVPSNH